MRTESLNEAVKDVECVVILTEHDEYRMIDLHSLKDLMGGRPAIVDARRILSPMQVKESGIVYAGAGFPMGA